MTSVSFKSGNSARRNASRLLAVSLLALAAACASPEQKLERYSKDAAEYLEEGDLAKAYIQYQNALKINEEHVPSLLGLAKIAEQRQDFQAMFGFLQRVARLDPNQVGVHVDLGKLYLISSDEKSALDEAEKALALDPNSVEAQALKAGVMLKLGDNAGAVELADKVLEKDPANSEAITVVVTDNVVNGNTDEALAELDRALELNPKVAMLQLLRIHLLKTQGREDEARAAYVQLIDIFPNDVSYRRVYANDLLRSRDFEGARVQLEKIAELSPENLNDKLNVVRAIKAAGDEAAAEARMAEFVAADPDNVDLKFALSDYYTAGGEPDKSREILNGLAASSDQDVAFRAKNRIAGNLLVEGEREEATKLIDEILAADEHNTDALMKRAALQIDDENYDQAIVNLRTALDNSPDNAEAMILMARAFERQDNFSFAQAEFAKAFEASGRSASVANRFAKYLVRRQNLARADEVLVDSLAAHSGDLENLRLLATIRLTQQDWSGAEEVAKMIEAVGDTSALASNIKSAAYVGLDDFNAVIDTLSARSEVAPLDARPLSALVAAYLKEDRVDEAEALLDKILDKDSENYTAKLLLARVYGFQGDDDKAEAMLISATQSSPAEPEAYEVLYRGYLRANRAADAEALIERGLKAAPDSFALKVFEADVLLNRGEREKAFEIYSQLVKERPDDRIVANNFVSLSSDLRFDEASVARALEVAKKIEAHDNSYFRDTVGWAYYRAKDYKTAVSYLEEAVKYTPDNAEMHYHLGAAQIGNGDVAAGKENLRLALEKGGDNFVFEKEVRALLDGQ